MSDAVAACKRHLRVTRGFEASRLEDGFLAEAYERVVPIASRRRPAGTTDDSLENRDAQSVVEEMDFQSPLAMERHSA